MESEDMLKKSLSDEVESEESLPEKKKSFWKKVPFIGLILILLKNVLAGISDIVTKKMTDIDPITLIFFRSTVMLSLGNGSLYLLRINPKKKVFCPDFFRGKCNQVFPQQYLGVLSRISRRFLPDIR